MGEPTWNLQSKVYSLWVGEQSVVFWGGSAKSIICRWVSKVYSLWVDEQSVVFLGGCAKLVGG